MREFIQKIREERYSSAKSAWKEVMPKIQKNKRSLRAMLKKQAAETSGGDRVKLAIETQAANELLEMGPEEVGETLRAYDKFARDHESLLENQKVGFSLEAQRHWIPVLISKMKGLL